MRSLRNLKNLENKKVLVRVDFNVPIKNGRVADNFRLQVALPTIKFLQRKKAKVILISHLGSQNSKHEARNLKLSLKPVANYFPPSPKATADPPKLYAKVEKIKFVDDLLGEKAERAIEKMKGGEMILLENLRFYQGEKTNNPDFARRLASLAEIYVNEAFSVCHRSQASVVLLPQFLPAYAGFNLVKEVKNLRPILEKPQKPLIVILGGAKISTKIKALKNLAKKASFILIGGAMANNFLKAKDFKISESFFEKEMLKETKTVLKRFKKKIVLPVDVKIKLKVKSQKLKIKSQKSKVVNSNLEQLKDIKARFKILDIGKETIDLFAGKIKKAKQIVFNGPMGFFEEKPFDQGTKEIIRAILENKKAFKIIGGGETTVALRRRGAKKAKNLFVSTGGGAMLDFLAGKKMPGLVALNCFSAKITNNL